MVAPLALVTALAALVGVAVTAVPAVRDRPVARWHLGVAAVVELAVVVQAVLAVVSLVGGHRPASPATFGGYLLTVLLVLPFTAAVALEERTRWGSAALALGFLTVSVLMGRLTVTWMP